MNETIADLEYKIDFMNARLLYTLPEKQEGAKEQLREYHQEYFMLTGRNYIPCIQRRKYEEGDY